MGKYLDNTGLAYFWGKLKVLLNGKVDKVTGKGLSTEDFTTAEKTKLASIADNANAYTLPIASGILGGVKTTSAVQDVSDYTACPIDANGVVYFLNTTYQNASASVPGLMSSADYAKLAAFSEASAYATKSDVSSVYKYKGTVASYASLPANASGGDVYNTEDTGMNYAWSADDEEWDSLGGAVGIDAITNSEIDAIMV